MAQSGIANRKKCRRCGNDLRHIGRTQKATNNDHHNTLYECKRCEITVVGG